METQGLAMGERIAGTAALDITDVVPDMEVAVDTVVVAVTGAVVAVVTIVSTDTCGKGKQHGWREGHAYRGRGRRSL